jgi:hypothetical protein
MRAFIVTLDAIAIPCSIKAGIVRVASKGYRLLKLLGWTSIEQG